MKNTTSPRESTWGINLSRETAQGEETEELSIEHCSFAELLQDVLH